MAGRSMPQASSALRELYTGSDSRAVVWLDGADGRKGKRCARSFPRSAVSNPRGARDRRPDRGPRASSPARAPGSRRGSNPRRAPAYGPCRNAPPRIGNRATRPPGSPSANGRWHSMRTPLRRAPSPIGVLIGHLIPTRHCAPGRAISGNGSASGSRKSRGGTAACAGADVTDSAPGSGSVSWAGAGSQGSSQGAVAPAAAVRQRAADSASGRTPA